MMQYFKILLSAVVILFISISCSSSKSGDDQENVCENDGYEQDDAEALNADDISFEVLTEAVEEAPDDYNQIYGLRYNGVSLKCGDGYLVYQEGVDYTYMIPTIRLALNLARRYGYYSNGIDYPTKEQWTEFENNVLAYLNMGGQPLFERITDAKWRKIVGDEYYMVEETSYYERKVRYGESYYKYRDDGFVILESAPADNPYNLPETAIIAR